MAFSRVFNFIFRLLWGPLRIGKEQDYTGVYLRCHDCHHADATHFFHGMAQCKECYEKWEKENPAEEEPDWGI